jgi:phage/plasmid-like protein (TIGR03299 family)
MAHLVETMAYNKNEVPWHGLGVPVLGDLTPQQMLEKAGLDWTVDKVPTYIKDNANYIPTGRSALVRSKDNKILTQISEDWNPVQNIDAFNFFNEFVMAGDMDMNTAGSLKGGNMVWALAKVNSSFSLFKGKDVVESYLLFSNPHEYGKSIDIRFTPIRVVCNNTLTLSLKEKTEMSVKINHRKAFDPEMAKTALGLAQNRLSEYREAATFLSSKFYKETDVVQYFKDIFPVLGKKSRNEETKNDMSRPASIVHDLLLKQPGAEFGEGTWWQALNAVTYATDHVLGHSDDTRMTSSWYGENRKKKLSAVNKALEYAHAS